MTFAFPPLSPEDKLPHAQAVWREEPSPPDGCFDRQVSVDYGDGAIEQTTVGAVLWRRVAKWRFGWSPER